MIISQEYLKSIFTYESGCLYWKIKVGARAAIGSKAGCEHSNGYIGIGLNEKSYLAHRLIFLIEKGYLPEFLDHADGDKLNNRIENLRECTKSQNRQNSKTSKHNTSGTKGVDWNKRVQKWRARICVNGKSKFLGFFNEIETAELALKIERVRLHGAFANHGEGSA